MKWSEHDLTLTSCGDGQKHQPRPDRADAKTTLTPLNRYDFISTTSPIIDHHHHHRYIVAFP
jgi:hypothetical protein